MRGLPQCAGEHAPEILVRTGSPQRGLGHHRKVHLPMGRQILVGDQIICSSGIRTFKELVVVVVFGQLYGGSGNHKMCTTSDQLDELLPQAGRPAAGNGIRELVKE